MRLNEASTVRLACVLHEHEENTHICRGHRNMLVCCMKKTCMIVGDTETLAMLSLLHLPPNYCESLWLVGVLLRDYNKLVVSKSTNASYVLGRSCVVHEETTEGNNKTWRKYTRKKKKFSLRSAKSLYTIVQHMHKKSLSMQCKFHYHLVTYYLRLFKDIA